jgi:hypothetical protein
MPIEVYPGQLFSPEIIYPVGLTILFLAQYHQILATYARNC